MKTFINLTIQKVGLKLLEFIVKNYNQATQVVENCKQKIFELKGAIAAVEDILKPEEELTES